MKKNNIVLSEAFKSNTEQELKENLQKAVDQYLTLMLRNGGLPAGKPK